MRLVWHGDYSSATRGEYDRTRDQLSRETHRKTGQNREDKGEVYFRELSKRDQARVVLERLKLLSL